MENLVPSLDCWRCWRPGGLVLLAVGEDGNQHGDSEPQQTLYEEEQQSPEAEFLYPALYVHLDSIEVRDQKSEELLL